MICLGYTFSFHAHTACFHNFAWVDRGVPDPHKEDHTVLIKKLPLCRVEPTGGTRFDEDLLPAAISTKWHFKNRGPFSLNQSHSSHPVLLAAQHSYGNDRSLHRPNLNSKLSCRTTGVHRWYTSTFL